MLTREDRNRTRQTDGGRERQIGRGRKQETEKYAWEMEKGRILTDQTEKCESERLAKNKRVDR